MLQLCLLSPCNSTRNIFTIFEGSDRFKISEQRLYLVVNDWLVPSHKDSTKIPLIEFLQEDKRIYYVVVKTFCDSILPQICEPPESTTSDAEGGVSLGV